MKDASKNFATLQDFIVGRLSGAELHAFEDRLMRDPALVQELELSLRMREGLQRLRSQGHPLNAAPRSVRLGVWAPLLMAASAAAVALFLWLSRTTPVPILLSALAPAAAHAASPLAAQFTFVAMRGNSTPRLELPASGMIEIRTAPGAGQLGQRFRVALTRQIPGGTAQPVATVPGLTVGADGWVHCYADAARLTPGSYILHLAPEGSSTQAAEAFPFTLEQR